MSGLMRTRWAAIGAAVAVTLGAGGISLTHAVIDEGVKNVLVPVEPCRLVDNRTAPDTVGDSDDPLPAGSPVTFDAFGTNGNCTLPASFNGLLINVTPVNATANTDIRLYPAGGAPPLSSNLNPEAGTLPVPNLVSVGVSNAGQFNVLNKFGTVNIVIDVLAYYDDHNHDDRYAETKNGKMAYAWVCSTAATAALNTPVDLNTSCNDGYQFNSEGGDVTSRRTGVGVYQVRFADLSMSLGHPQVTAYGNNSNACKVGGWSGSQITVRCYTAAGGAVNTPFNVFAVD